MTDPPNLVEVLNDTEGLVLGLYYHLWKRTHKGEPCPGVNIPHTVIYQDSTPIAWYFVSSKDNRIYRKKRNNIHGPSIFDAMSKHKNATADVCAWFSGSMTLMSASPKKSRRGYGGDSEPLYELAPEEETKEPACFDYLHKDRLQTLVSPSQYTAITESLYDGALQKFVMPREASDHIIRAIWSPTACVCERRTSNVTLDDERQVLKDRMASFDAASVWLSTHHALPPGSVLVQRITNTCEAIVRHLAEISSGKISIARMQLYFKIDTKNRIWLTMCNSLRLDRTAAQVDRSPSVSRPYAIKDTTRSEDVNRLPVDTTPFLCVLTGKTCPGSDRCDVSYKMLMQAWLQQVAQLQTEADRLQALDSIPPAIRRANPNITREYYLRMRAQPNFMLRTAPASAAAATSLTAAAIQDLSRIIARPQSALADSASGKLLSAPIPQELLARPDLSKSKPNQGGLKLMLSTGPPPPPPPNPNILYEPGTAIPAALMPRLQGTGSKTSPHATQGSKRSNVMNSGVQAPRAARGPPPLTLPNAPLSQAAQSRLPPSPFLPTGAGRPHAPTNMVPTVKPSHISAWHSEHRYHHHKSEFDTRPARKQPTAAAAGAKSPGAESSTPSVRSPILPGRPYLASWSPKSRPGSAKSANGGAAGSSPKPGTSRQPHVSTDDLRTLKELSAAYASAEAKTQQLLAEAQDLLGETGAPPIIIPSTAAGKAPGSSSRPPSGKPASRRTSNLSKGSRPSSAVPVKEAHAQPAGEAAAGLTNDEAALLSEALQES